MRYFNLSFIFLIFSFFPNHLYCSKIYELFNQKITIDKNDLKAKEFFDYLSKMTEIKFKI